MLKGAIANQRSIFGRPVLRITTVGGQQEQEHGLGLHVQGEV